MYAGVGLINFIYDNDNAVIELKSPLQYKARLRHRTLGGIDQKKHTVYHLQYSLYFAAEIGMSGGIYYVYFGIFIVNGGILGKYCYTAFSLQVSGVHYPDRCRLIVAIHAALLEHFVNERGFTVVDMGYNGYVSKIISYQFDTLPTVFNF